MTLSEKEIEGLLRLAGLTRDEEIDCDECLARIAEFAERELAGRPMSAALDAVTHHLTVCAECREEYRALRRALEENDG